MLNLEWLKEVEVIKHDFAYEIMAESTRDSLFCHHCFKFNIIGHGIKKHKHIGYFDTPEEAHQAYKNAAKALYGEFANFGRDKQ